MNNHLLPVAANTRRDVEIRRTLTALDAALFVLVGIDNPDVMRLANALTAWRWSETEFDASLGLPGDWREKVRAQRRRDAFKQLADTDYPRHSDRQLARDLIKAAAVYQRAGGKSHLRDGRRPDGQQGRLYDLLMTGPLPGFEKLRKEINALCGYENAVSRTQKNQDRGCSTKEPS